MSDDADSTDTDTADESEADAPEASETDTTDESDTADESAEPPTAEEITAALDAAASALDEAATEADLDAVEADLDAVDAQIEAADFPEPAEDDEDPESESRDRLDELRDTLEAERGPYAEEVAESAATTAETIRETRWTDDGVATLREAVGEFTAAVTRGLPEGTLFAPDAVSDADGDALADAVQEAADVVADSGLDPDADADSLVSLVEATDALHEATETAEEFADLTTRDQLRAEGYFDVLGHYKDFPVEWAAMKEHEQQGNTEMVTLALDKLDSDFLERHAMESLTRMNDRAAFEAVHARAQKRDRPAVTALGKMAAEEAVETLVEFVGEESNPQLQKVTFTALGEIGHPDAVGPLADQLAADNAAVRPYAARALGLIGDTRAVEPLAATLADDADDATRAAAAWALRQIGTERALEHAASATDDAAYIVQSEAERAADALGEAPTP